MRRTASEIINELENRVARLEKQAGYTYVCLIYRTGGGVEFSVPWEAKSKLKKIVEESVKKHGFGTKKMKFELIGETKEGVANFMTYKLMIRPGDPEVVIKDIENSTFRTVRN